MKIKLSKKTIEKIHRLVLALIENKDGEVPKKFPKFGKIPEGLILDKSKGDSIMLDEESTEKYSECLSSLLEEKQLEYLSKRTIEKELWYLTCQILVQPEKCKNIKHVQDLVASLQNRLVKPIEEWEIIVPLENIKIGSYQYDFNGIKLFEMSPGIAEQWGIEKDQDIKEKHIIFNRLYDQTVGKTVVFLNEKAADSDKAIEYAQNRVNELLEIFRLYLLIDHQPRIIDWMIDDRLLLFKPSEIVVIRNKKDQKKYNYNWKLGHTGVQINIDEKRNNQIDTSKLIVGEILNKFPNRLLNRYKRVVHWISHSVTDEELDYKIVDICTALESILAKESDLRKGECVALRMQLLGFKLNKWMYSPRYILDIYEKRSNIIHGSSLKICSKRDYNIGRLIAIDILVKSLEYINIIKLTRYEDFLNSLTADTELIEKAVDFWENTKYYEQIKLAASKLKEKCISEQ